MAVKVDWKGLGEAVAWTVAGYVVAEVLTHIVDLPSVAMVFFPGVAYVSSRNSRAAGVFCSLLSVLAVQYAFQLPRYSLAVSGVQDVLAFVVMLLVSLLINSLAVQLKKNAQAAGEAAAIIQAEKTRADLLAAVSHDLRTPLATIEGSASALLEQGELSEQSRQLAASVQSDSQRMARLIGNLLDMTRMQGKIALDLDWYALDELVANAVLRTESLLDNPVNLIVQSGVPLVRADGVLVEQVFVNLLENAARHAGKSAHVTVEIGLGEDVVWANVLDDGPGIPPGAETKMFERFWGSPGKGAGLGLAICRAAMSAHGGKIAGQNRPGGGLCLCVEFPAKMESNG